MAIAKKIIKLPINLAKRVKSDIDAQIDYSVLKKRAASIALGGPLGYWTGTQIDKAKLNINKNKTDKFKNVYNDKKEKKTKDKKEENKPSEEKQQKEKELDNTSIVKNTIIQDEYKEDDEKIGLTNNLLVKENQEIINLKDINKRENNILVEQKNLLSDIKEILKTSQLKTQDYKNTIKEIKSASQNIQQPSKQITTVNNNKEIQQYNDEYAKSTELTMIYNQNMIEEMRDMNQNMKRVLQTDPDKNMFKEFGKWFKDIIKNTYKQYLTPKALVKRALIGKKSKAEKDLGIGINDDYYDKDIKIQKQTYYTIRNLLNVTKGIADTIGAEYDLSDTKRRGGILTYIKGVINKNKQEKKYAKIAKKQRDKITNYKDTLNREQQIDEDYQYYLDNKNQYNIDEQKKLEKEYNKGKKILQKDKDKIAGKQQNTLLLDNIKDIKDAIKESKKDNKNIQQNILNGMIDGINKLINLNISLDQNQKLTLYTIQDGFNKLIQMKDENKFETILIEKIDNIYNQLLIMDLKSLNDKSINRSLQNIQSSNSLDLLNFKNLLIPKKQKDQLEISSGNNIESSNKLLDKIDISNSYLYKIWSSIIEWKDKSFELQTKSITDTYLENKEKEEDEKKEEKRFDNINDLLKDIKGNTKKSVFSKFGTLIGNLMKFLPVLMPFLIPGPGSIWDITKKIKSLFGLGGDKEGILPDTNIFSSPQKETFLDKIKEFLNKYLLEPLRPIGTWLKTNLFDPIWDKLKPGVDFVNDNIIQPIMKILTPIFEKSIKPITDKIGNFLSNAWDDIKLNSGQILNSIGETLTKVGKSLIEALPNLFKFLFLNPTSIMFGVRALSSWIIKSKFYDKIGETIISPIMGLIGTGFKKTFSFFDDKLFSGKIKKIMNNQMGNIFTKSAKIFGTVTSTIGTGINKIAIGMGSLITTLASNTNTMIYNLSSKLFGKDGIFNKLFGKRNGIIDISKISSSISSMISKSKTFISNIGSWFIGTNGIFNKLGGKLFGSKGILSNKTFISKITDMASKSKSFIGKLTSWFVGSNGLFATIGGRLFGSKGLFAKGGKWLIDLTKSLSGKLSTILAGAGGWIPTIFGKLSGVLSGIFSSGGVLSTVGSAIMGVLTGPVGWISLIAAGIGTGTWAIVKMLNNKMEDKIKEEIDYFDPSMDIDISLEEVRDIINDKHQKIVEQATGIMDDIVAVLMNINDIVNEKEQKLLFKQTVEGLETYNKHFLTNAVPILENRGYISKGQGNAFKKLLSDEDVNNEIMGELSSRTITKIKNNNEMIEYPNTGMVMPVNAAYNYWLESDDNDFSIKYRNELAKEYNGDVQKALADNNPIISMAPFMFLARFKNKKLNDIMQDILSENLDIVDNFKAQISNQQINMDINKRETTAANIVPTEEDLINNTNTNLSEIIKNKSSTLIGGIDELYSNVLQPRLNTNEVNYTIGQLKQSALNENNELFNENEIAEIQMMNTNSARLGFERILDRYIENMEKQIEDKDKKYYETLLDLNAENLNKHFKQRGLLEEDEDGNKIVLIKNDDGNVTQIIDFESINKLLTLQGISKDKELIKKILLDTEQGNKLIKNFEYEVPKIKKKTTTTANTISSSDITSLNTTDKNIYYTTDNIDKYNENTRTKEDEIVVNTLSNTLTRLINNTDDISELYEEAIQTKMSPRVKKALFELLGIEDDLINGDLKVPKELEDSTINILNMPSEAKLLPDIMNNVEQKIKEEGGLNYKDKLKQLSDISEKESVLSIIGEKTKEGWKLTTGKAEEYTKATKDWTVENINKWMEEGTLKERVEQFQEKYPEFSSVLKSITDDFKDIGQDTKNKIEEVKETIQGTTDAVVEGTQTEEEVEKEIDEYENTWWDKIKGSIDSVKDFIQSNDFVTILAKGYKKGQELITGVLTTFADIMDLITGKNTRNEEYEETNKTKVAEAKEAAANQKEQESYNKGSTLNKDEMLREVYGKDMTDKEWIQYSKDLKVNQMESKNYNSANKKTTLWEHAKNAASTVGNTISGWFSNKDNEEEIKKSSEEDKIINREKLIKMIEDDASGEEIYKYIKPYEYHTNTELREDMPSGYDSLYYDKVLTYQLDQFDPSTVGNEIQLIKAKEDYYKKGVEGNKEILARNNNDWNYLNYNYLLNYGKYQKFWDKPSTANTTTTTETVKDISNEYNDTEMDNNIPIITEEQRKEFFNNITKLGSNMLTTITSPMQGLRSLFNNMIPETENKVLEEPLEIDTTNTTPGMVDVNFNDGTTDYTNTTTNTPNTLWEYSNDGLNRIIPYGYEESNGVTPYIYDIMKYETGKRGIQNTTRDLMDKFINLFKKPEVVPEEQASGFFDPFTNNDKVKFNFDRIMNILNMKDIVGMMKSNNSDAQMERLVAAAEKTYEELNQISNNNSSVVVNNPISVNNSVGGNSVSSSGGTTNARPLGGHESAWIYEPILEKAFKRSHEI